MPLILEMSERRNLIPMSRTSRPRGKGRKRGGIVDLTMNGSFLLILLLFFASATGGGGGGGGGTAATVVGVGGSLCDRPESFFSPSANTPPPFHVLRNVVPAAKGVTYFFFDDAVDFASCACECERNATCQAALWAKKTCIFVGCGALPDEDDGVIERVGLASSTTTSIGACGSLTSPEAEMGETLYLVVDRGGSRGFPKAGRGVTSLPARSSSFVTSPIVTGSTVAPFTAAAAAVSHVMGSIAAASDAATVDSIPLTTGSSTKSIDSSVVTSARSSKPVFSHLTPSSSATSSSSTSAWRLCAEPCPANSHCVASGRQCVCNQGFKLNRLGACVVGVSSGAGVSDADLSDRKGIHSSGTDIEDNDAEGAAEAAENVDLASSPASATTSVITNSLKTEAGRDRQDYSGNASSSSSSSSRRIAQTSQSATNLTPLTFKAALFTPKPKIASDTAQAARNGSKDAFVSEKSPSNDPVDSATMKPERRVVPDDHFASGNDSADSPPSSTSAAIVPTSSGPYSLSSLTTSPSTSSSVSPPPPAPPPRLVVSAGDSRVLQLPERSISITAYALPKPKHKDDYEYSWTLVSHPKSTDGKVEGANKKTLVLKDLTQGLYQLKVVVVDKRGSGKDSSSPPSTGEALVNVTVLPPKRINRAPVAIIKPTTLEVKEGNTAILDGSQSTDDDKIESYKWEEVGGPVETQGITGDKSMLKLDHLTPGHYRFKLTVVDSDGVSNSTSAVVKVNKEKDYPPKADAGSDVVIYLPRRDVVIAGNQSSDDKGIASYEWSKSSADGHTPDMTGVHTPFLHLSQLQVGDYAFTLTVTDTGGNKDHASVHVFVKEKAKETLKADAGHDITVTLPESSAILDATNSSTEKDGTGAAVPKIVAYHWAFLSATEGDAKRSPSKSAAASSAVASSSSSSSSSSSPLKAPTPFKQTAGIKATSSATSLIPPKVEIVTPEKARTVVRGLTKAGKYSFRLTVTDDKKHSARDTVVVTMVNPSNVPPVANAGADQVVKLPINFIKIDGSKSTDDKEIETFEWTRDVSSPAAGEVIGNSNRSPVLLLSNLVPGRYCFHLNVTDKEGLSSVDSAILVIQRDQYSNEVLEIDLFGDLASFTEGDKQKLVGALRQLLKQPAGNVLIKIHHIYQDRHTSRIIIIFHVELITKEVRQMLKGLAVLKELKDKMRLAISSSPSSSSSLLPGFPYHISRIDTVLCQNNCSGHGKCSIFNKRCECHAFWMENFFKARPSGPGWLDVGESNCDWSILYVVIIVFVVVIVVAAVVWGLVVFCCCRHRRRQYHHQNSSSSSKSARGRSGSSASRRLLSPKRSETLQHRGYTLLEDFGINNSSNNNNNSAVEDDDDSFEKMLTTASAKKRKKKVKGLLQSSSLMVSESEGLTSEEKEDEDEETLFGTATTKATLVDDESKDELKLGYSNGGLVQRGGGGGGGGKGGRNHVSNA